MSSNTLPNILITNLKGIIGAYGGSVPRLLKGADQDQIPILTDAWLHIKDGKVAEMGKMQDGLPTETSLNREVHDGTGRWAFPGFVDSHTHLVFAGSREAEFEDRIRGLTYQEIAARGGGILNSAAKLQATPEDDLYLAACARLDQVIRMGTTAIEIKSGYGLTLADELKMLRVIRRLADNFPIRIKATFLGAHAVPRSFPDRATYLKDVLSWIPIVAAEGLADYVDIFCEANYFTIQDAAAVIETGAKHGLRAKIHGNQLAISGGVQVAVNHGALSVDHLEQIGEEEIESLKLGHTLPVLLPGCSFFIGIPYAPARKLLNAGLPVVIASDYNPGSCPSGNMPLLWSLACTQLRMTPAEAINAMTLNAAAALELEDSHGSITLGRPANLWLSAPIPSWQFLPYHYGTGAQMVERVMVDGAWYNGPRG